MTLDEKVFRKMGAVLESVKTTNYHPALQWCLNNQYISEALACSDYHAKYLPKISSQWEVCAKWLVPFMGERKYVFVISHYPTPSINEWNNLVFYWTGTKHCKEVIVVDYNFALAACEAFMEVKL